MDNEPDFSRRESKFSWEINMPTILTACGMCVAGLMAYGNFQVDRNDVKWAQKVEGNDIESLKKAQEANSAAIRVVADGLQQTNKVLDRLAQLVEWEQQNPRKPENK